MKYKIVFSMLLSSTLFGSQPHSEHEAVPLPKADIILSILQEKCSNNFVEYQTLYSAAADELAGKAHTAIEISWILHNHFARPYNTETHWQHLDNAATSIFQKARELQE